MNKPQLTSCKGKQSNIDAKVGHVSFLNGHRYPRKIENTCSQQQQASQPFFYLKMLFSPCNNLEHNSTKSVLSVGVKDSSLSRDTLYLLEMKTELGQMHDAQLTQ